MWYNFSGVLAERPLYWAGRIDFSDPLVAETILIVGDKALAKPEWLRAAAFSGK